MVLMENVTLMNVEIIAECSNNFDLHSAIVGIENQFLVFLLSGRIRQVFLYSNFCLV